MYGKSALDIFEELRERQFQSQCNLFDVYQCHVALPPFDSTNISAVQPAHISELFLRNAEFSSSRTQSLAESETDILHLRLCVIFKSQPPMCPRTMSIIAE